MNSNDLFNEIVSQTPDHIELKIQRDFIEKNLNAAFPYHLQAKVFRYQDFTIEGSPEKWGYTITKNPLWKEGMSDEGGRNPRK